MPLLLEKSFPALAREHIRKLAVKSAGEGLELYENYRALYSNRYQPPLMSFCLAHLGDSVAKYCEPGQKSLVARFCLETFAEAAPAFKYIPALAAMLCESLSEDGVKMPPNVEQYFGGRAWASFTRQARLDCCERWTFTQPVSMLIERLDPEIADSFEAEWKVFIETHGGNGPEGSSTTRMMDVSRLINP